MKRLTSTLLILSLAPAAYAELTPKSHIGLAGIDFQSQLGVDYGHESNVTYQRWADDAIDSDFWTLSPMIQAIGERGEDRYTLMYSGEFRRYDASSADDYQQHFLQLETAWRFGRMHGLSVNLSQNYGQERRGQGISEGFNQEELAEYGFADAGLKNSLSDSQVRYSYGAPEGRGKFEVMAQRKTLSFRDTDDFKLDQDFYDHLLQQEWREDTLVLDLFDQYSSKSRFRYSLITNRRHYKQADNKRSNEYYLLFGVNSEQSGKTTIEGNVALLYKDFPNDDNAKTFTGFNWDLTLDWQPVNHSTFSFSTWQKVKDPEQEGGYILESNYGLAWTHHWWVERLTTTLGYRYQTDDYRIPNQDRLDRVQVAKASIGYDFRPSIRLELNYQWSKLASNTPSSRLVLKEPDYDSSGAPIDGTEKSVNRLLGYEDSLIQLLLKVQI